MLWLYMNVILLSDEVKISKSFAYATKSYTTKQAMEGVSHVSEGLTLSSRNIPFAFLRFYDKFQLFFLQGISALFLAAIFSNLYRKYECYSQNFSRNF